ncbi:MAG TPA: hypothetical protein VF223_12405 [Trebonia sp.]
MSVQFSELAASAAVWVKLMASPAGSTGLVAMSGRPASGFTAGADAAELEVAADAAADAPLGHGAGDAGALAPAAADATAPGEAQLASAALSTCESRPSVAATMAPIATASATGMATGTAMRAVLLRRHADRCLVGMQSTSMS